MRAVTLSMLMLAAVPAHAEVTTIRQAVDGFIRPAYADFAAKTKAESETVNALCAAPSEATLKQAQDGYVETVKAWSIIETVKAR